MILAAVIFAAGCSSRQKTANEANVLGSLQNEHPPRRQVIVYFADAHDEKLVPETREIRNEALATAVIESLIQGPKQEEHLPTIPPGTRLLNLNVQSGTALVNFSNEVTKGHRRGTADELLTVYSVVNSLTEVERIKRVRFLVDGHPVDTLNGGVDLSEPLVRESRLITE